MRLPAKIILSLIILIAVLMAADNPVYSMVVIGQKAPVFELVDVGGQQHSLATMESHPIISLYFFDVTSRSSQEGLLVLDDIIKRYANADLKVWAITRSAKKKVTQFVSSSRIGYPFLLDTSDISDQYQARFILPTICILGPKLKILDHIQGGGKDAIEKMLVNLAERQLQRKQPEVAEAISEKVSLKNPKNIEAKAIKAYAEFQGVDLDAAEKTFRSLAQTKGQGEILGKEGLVSIYAARGQYD